MGKPKVGPCKLDPIRRFVCKASQRGISGHSLFTAPAKPCPSATAATSLQLAIGVANATSDSICESGTKCLRRQLSNKPATISSPTLRTKTQLEAPDDQHHVSRGNAATAHHHVSHNDAMLVWRVNMNMLSSRRSPRRHARLAG